MSTRQTIYVNNARNYELKAPKGQPRSYFFLQNLSLDSIFYDVGTPATAENGIEIGAGLFVELGQATAGVPQGHIWIRGNAVADQRVLVVQA